MTKRWTVVFLTLTLAMLAGGGYLIAKPMIPTPADTPVLGELEPVLVKLLGKGAHADASLATVCDNAELKAQIAKHKIPRYIGFLDDALPRNASGKFMKRQLRETLDTREARSRYRSGERSRQNPVEPTPIRLSDALSSAKAESGTPVIC